MPKDNPRTLVYADTKKPVHIGDIVPVRGDRHEVLEIIEPSHPGSTGRVRLRDIESDFSNEYYPGAIDAEWVERFTIIHSNPISIQPLPNIDIR